LNKQFFLNESILFSLRSELQKMYFAQVGL